MANSFFLISFCFLLRERLGNGEHRHARESRLPARVLGGQDLHPHVGDAIGEVRTLDVDALQGATQGGIAHVASAAVGEGKAVRHRQGANVLRGRQQQDLAVVLPHPAPAQEKWNDEGGQWAR